MEEMIMVGWIIAAIIWFVGIFVSYFKFFKKWDEEDSSDFDKIWYSIVWPCMLVLFGIHYLFNGHN